MAKNKKAQAQAQEQAQAQAQEQEKSLYQLAIEKTAIINSSLENAVTVHAGGTSIKTKTDNNGKEYVSATFKLSVPTKKISQITVNDITVAQSLDRMKKQIALGEVATFAFCKEIANFADSDAKKLGFDTTTDLAQGLFGLGKSTIANYRRVGQYFISDDLMLKGAIPQECSISLLNQLLSFVTKEKENGEPDITNVECLFKYGILTPYMKQKDYKKVISALKALETKKELKDMDNLEVEAFKKLLDSKLSPKAEEQAQEQEQAQAQEQAQEQAQAQEKADEEPTNDSDVILGQSMSMLKTLEENINKLILEKGISDELQGLVTMWIDNIYSFLGDMI